MPSDTPYRDFASDGKASEGLSGQHAYNANSLTLSGPSDKLERRLLHMARRRFEWIDSEFAILDRRRLRMIALLLSVSTTGMITALAFLLTEYFALESHVAVAFFLASAVMVIVFHFVVYRRICKRLVQAMHQRIRAVLDDAVLDDALREELREQRDVILTRF